MPGRRFFQKGNVNVPPTNESGAGLQRFALILVGIVAIGIVPFSFSSFIFSSNIQGQSLGALLVNTSSTTASAAQIFESGGQIHTDVQNGSSQDESGLVKRALSSEALEQSMPLLGQAEARLIKIYQLISQAERKKALQQAEALVHDYPNFHLANLVLGDLLSVSSRPISQVGDVPGANALAAHKQLEVLREQSRRRLQALTERPPTGSVPSQFVSVSLKSRHAIAVDASRSRLYLFENQQLNGENSQLTLVGDYYISVGQSGVEKVSEGDLRTPVGVYYITSNLDASKLPDLYGAGALPINYPNALDTQRGKTGSGIWLHGSPSEQFARPPLASEGCVVLSNQDLKTLLSKVEIRTTPVVIAPDLKWVMPEALSKERQQFNQALEDWRASKSQGDTAKLKSFYSTRFDSQGQKLVDWWPRTESEMHAMGVKTVEMKDVSVLNWRDTDDTMVVTFGELRGGQSRGVTKRQYWIREGLAWKIFNEGTV